MVECDADGSSILELAATFLVGMLVTQFRSCLRTAACPRESAELCAASMDSWRNDSVYKRVLTA